MFHSHFKKICIWLFFDDIFYQQSLPQYSRLATHVIPFLHYVIPAHCSTSFPFFITSFPRKRESNLLSYHSIEPSFPLSVSHVIPAKAGIHLPFYRNSTKQRTFPKQKKAPTKRQSSIIETINYHWK